LVIEVKTELSWFEQEECVKYKKEEEVGEYLITKLIVNWNLEGEDGKSLPIEQDVIRRLPADIILPIVAQLTKIANDKLNKKKD